MRSMSLSTLIGLLSLGHVLANQLPLSSPPRPSGVLDKDVLDDEFETWLADLTSEWGMKGISISVVQRLDDGQWNVETKGYGVKNAAGDPVTPDTIFSIQSNSKLITTLALGTLISNANTTLPLEWTTKVSSLLPDDWKLQDPVAEQNANLLDLIAHRTGLPRHDLGWHRGQKMQDAVRGLRYLRPSAEFREIWQYNNWMYMTVATIISRISGIPFAEYVQSRIFDRLPFGSATYNTTRVKESGHLAEGFARVKRGVGTQAGGEGWSKSVYKPVPLFIGEEGEEDIFAGAGGVFMSGRDTATWLQTLLLEGRHPETNEEIIPAAALRQAVSSIIVDRSTPKYPEVSISGYGGGQAMFAYQGHNIEEHDGGWVGWLSTISRAHDDGLGIAVLTNWDEGADVMVIVKNYLYEQALGLPHVDWRSRTRAEREVQLQEWRANAPGVSPSSTQLRVQHLIGTYSHPAYGQYEICPPPSSSASSSAPLSDSVRCADSDTHWSEVLKANASAFPSPTLPVLGAALTAGGANFMTLTHLRGDIFTASFFDIYYTPLSPGRVVVVPHFDRAPNVEFSLTRDGTGDGTEAVEGFAFTGGAWGQGAGVRGTPKGKTIKERAEVWFDRL